MFELPALPASLPVHLPTDLPSTLPLDAGGWHWLDVTLAVCVVFVALNAARRGFVREAGTLVGLGVGLALAGRHGLALADLVAAEFGQLPFLDEAVWLAVVLLCGSVAALLAGALRCMLPLPGIGMADRFFGLAFGVLEGAAGLGLALLFAGRLGAPGLSASGYDGSLLAPVLLRWWLVVAASLPPELGFPRSL